MVFKWVYIKLLFLFDYLCYTNIGDIVKTITLYIKNESDLYEKYSNNISKDLINYLIRETKFINEDVNVVVKTNLKINNIEQLIKEGLFKAYKESKKIDNFLNNKQIIFFIIGIIFLIFSTFIKYDVIKEIIIISGWVAIWEVVDISLNVDSELKINRKLISKLMSSKIEINKN